jgi:hypothetical protein
MPSTTPITESAACWSVCHTAYAYCPLLPAMHLQCCSVMLTSHLLQMHTLCSAVATATRLLEGMF